MSQVHTFVQIEKAVIRRNNSSICGKVKQQEPQQEYESIDKKGGEDNNHDNSIVVLKEMVHSRKQIDWHLDFTRREKNHWKEDQISG